MGPTTYRVLFYAGHPYWSVLPVKAGPPVKDSELGRDWSLPPVKAEVTNQGGPAPNGAPYVVGPLHTQATRAVLAQTSRLR